MKKMKIFLQWTLIAVYLGILAACASSSGMDPEGGISGTGVKIDCEQEANKYRKPCRGDRW